MGLREKCQAKYRTFGREKGKRKKAEREIAFIAYYEKINAKSEAQNTKQIQMTEIQNLCLRKHVSKTS